MTTPAALFRDSRYALRVLGRSPGFTIAAGLTLALGIGANTAIFSVVKTVLLEGPPYRAPERLVMIWNASKPADPTWISLQEVVSYRDATTLQALGAYTETAANLTGSGEPERVRTAGVTANLFDVLGVAAAHGQTFRDHDGVTGAPGAIILSHRLWQRRFGGDRALVGSTIEVEGRPRTVLGVLPQEFRLPLDYRSDEPIDAFIPLVIDPANLGNWGNRSYYAVGRLADGVEASESTAELGTIADRWVQAGFVTDQGDGQLRRTAVPMTEFLSGSLRAPLLVLLAAVACVLLIACANVVNLLLVRADSRRQEVAIRTALGADVGTLMRQSLAESFVLAAIGGGAGLVVARLALDALIAFRPAGLPHLDAATIDGAVLLFTAALCVAAAVLVGLGPAIRFSRAGLAAALRESTRSATPGVRRQTYRQALVVAQLACSVVLVVVAGLLVRTLVKLTQADLGFDTSRVLTAQLQLPASSYPQPEHVVDFYTRLLDRASRLPEVSAAGAIRILPLSRTIGNWSITLEGREAAPAENINADFQWTTPGYFRAMAMDLSSGRLLEDADRPGADPVAVVNETMAARYWPGTEALGTRFRLGTNPARPWVTIVGIVRPSRHNAIVERDRAEMYLAHAQLPQTVGNAARAMAVVLKTTDDPMRAARPFRDLVRELDPRLPVSDMRALDEIASRAVSTPRFAASLLGAFALLALALAVVGVYGTVSLFVAQRGREIGVRLALGAEPREIIRLVLRQGLALAAMGAVIGLVAASLAARALTSWLYGVAPLDPVTFAAVPVVLGLATLAACIIPARRAAALDPITALR
jgi:putative ABC transport system permease protein